MLANPGGTVVLGNAECVRDQTSRQRQRAESVVLPKDITRPRRREYITRPR
jgi:hypothetical protein